MAKKLISASSLFKGDPSTLFDSFNQGAKDATTSIKSLIDVNSLLQGKLKEVGEAGEVFAKNFDKKKAKDIEALDKQVTELVKSQDNLNETIKQQAKLVNKLEDALKKKKQEDTAEAKLAKEKVRLQKQINGQTEDQAKENTKLRKTIQQNRKATRELVDIEQELGKEYKDLKDVIEDLDNVELRRVSTVKEAQEQNKALRIIVRNLNKEIPEQAEQIKNLNAVIDENSELQKENADALTAQKINIGNYKESVTDALSETGLFGDELGKLNSIINTALDLVGPLSEGVADYADNTDDATTSTKGLGKAFKGLNTAFKASVVGLVIVAIASIGAAFTQGRAGAIRFEIALSNVQNTLQSILGVLSNAGTGFIKVFQGAFTITKSFQTALFAITAAPLLPIVNAINAIVQGLSAIIPIPAQVSQNLQALTTTLNQFVVDGATGLSDIKEGAVEVGEGIGDIVDAFSGLPDAIEGSRNATEREVAFIKDRFDIIDDLAALRIKIAELNSEIALFDQQAGDTTRTLNERIKASNNAIELEEDLIKLRKEQAALELKESKTQILIDLERNKSLSSRADQIEALIQLGEGNDDLEFFKQFVALQRDIDELGENSQLVENYEELTASIENSINVLSEAEVELANKRKERLENERDLFEQNLDLIIDLGEANRALLEQQVNDTRRSVTERSKLFKQLTSEYTSTVEDEQNEFNRLIKENNRILKDDKPELDFSFDEDGFKLLIGSTEIATDNIVELNKAVQTQTNLDEVTIKRLLEVIKEGKTATREFTQLDRELQEVIASVRELQSETILDEEELDKIQAFNEDFQAFLASIPEDLSKLSDKEFKVIQNKQEEFNERRLKEQEEFEKKQIELQIIAINEKIEVLRKEQGFRFAQSEEFAELNKQRRDLDLQLDKRNEEDKTKNLEEELKNREDAEKESAENRKKIQEQILEGLGEGIIERTKNEVENITDQVNALDERINALQQTAQIGNEIQEQNLVSLRKRKADLERERLETEERLLRIQAAITVFESYTANLQNDPNTALTKTIIEANVLKALSKSLVSNFDGTENTGPGGSVDNKGGFLSVIHPYERVVPRALNNVMKKDSGSYMSNEELAHAAQAWNNGIFTTAMIDPATMTNNNFKSNEAILQQFTSLEKTLKELPGQMPVPRYDYEPLTGAIQETVRRGNNIERRSKSIRSKLHINGK